MIYIYKIYVGILLRLYLFVRHYYFTKLQGGSGGFTHGCLPDVPYFPEKFYSSQKVILINPNL